jgi:hypothetical protein
MYSKTCPIPVKNVRDKLIEMTPLSSLLSDCRVDMACDTDFAMYYSVFTDIRIGFNMSEK